MSDTSPAIDRGVTLTDLPVDYDGLGRPQGAAYDVGAFERPVGGYPDGGVLTDGGTGGGGSTGGGTAGGMGGGGTAPPKGGCQCSLAALRSSTLPLTVLILLLIPLALLRRRL